MTRYGSLVAATNCEGRAFSKYNRFSNPPSCVSVPSFIYCAVKIIWFVIILSQIIAIGTDALSSIRSQSTANIQ